MSSGRAVRGLALACHPLPALAVTVFAVVGTLGLGADAASASRLAVAVLVGQLSVGWANDSVDAPHDVAAARTSKPVVAGLVSRRVVGTSAVVTLVAAVVLSFPLGLAAGGMHVVAVLSAWAYDLGLKTTWLSPLPYVVAFGLLPPVVTAVATGSAHGPASRVVAAGLLGAAAHFANTVGDARSDALTGVRGLPQRLGPTASVRVAAVLVLLAALLLLAADGGLGTGLGMDGGPDVGGAGAVGEPGALSAVLLAGAVVVAAAGAVMRVGVAGGPAAFRLFLIAAALVVGGFVTGLR